MKVSLVINTFNRCTALRRTLESLAQQRYSDFEVIVVNGPSTDGTSALLATWKDRVKLADCPVANLAVSRNIGIAHAAGEIVAFIDDDAVAHPCWLERLVAGYDHPKVGAVGGFVFNGSGVEFQTTYIIADRFGGAVIHNPFDPTIDFNVPGAPRYATHLGTNTSVRRTLLLDLGGFDEEFEYYLDETDLCLRIVDSGYKVKYVPNAVVFHQFAANHLRNSDGMLVRRYPILKNQAYFAIKHGAPAHGFIRAIQSVVAFVDHHRRDVKYLVDNGLLPPRAISEFEDEANRAVSDGRNQGMMRPWVYPGSYVPSAEAPSFKVFTGRNVHADRLTICFLAESTEGYALVPDLAKTLAHLGHTVHLLTASAGSSTINLQDEVWCHRLAVTECCCPAPDIPGARWNPSRTLLNGIQRVGANDRIDVIQVPTAGCLAAAVLLDGTIPVIASVDKPVPAVFSAKLESLINRQALEEEVVPSLWWERRTVLFADGVLALNAAALSLFEEAYDIAIHRDRAAVLSSASDCRQAGSDAVSFFKTIIAASAATPCRRVTSSATFGFSRRCTLSEFWVTAPLFSWLRAVGHGAVDWRLWSYCLVLQGLSTSRVGRAIVLTDIAFPAIADYVLHTHVQQVQVSRENDLAREVSNLPGIDDKFDAVYSLALLDPCDDNFSGVLGALARLCRPGAKLHLVVVGGAPCASGSMLSDCRLTGIGLEAPRDWTALLAGAAEPAFSDPGVEPYLHAMIDDIARPIATIELRRLGAAADSTAPQFAI